MASAVFQLQLSTRSMTNGPMTYQHSSFISSILLHYHSYFSLFLSSVCLSFISFDDPPLSSLAFASLPRKPNQTSDNTNTDRTMRPSFNLNERSVQIESAGASINSSTAQTELKHNQNNQIERNRDEISNETLVNSSGSFRVRN